MKKGSHKGSHLWCSKRYIKVVYMYNLCVLFTGKTNKQILPDQSLSNQTLTTKPSINMIYVTRLLFAGQKLIFVFTTRDSVPKFEPIKTSNSPVPTDGWGLSAIWHGLGIFRLYVRKRLMPEFTEQVTRISQSNIWRKLLNVCRNMFID